MACNCATTQQINELYRRYGERKAENRRKRTFWQWVKYIIMYTGVVIAMIPIAPALFLYVLYKAFCDDDKKISLKKFFRLGKNNVAYVGK